MNTIATLFGATVLAIALPASAAPSATGGDPLGQCVQLSDGHRGARAAGNSQLLLKDGRSHYRVSFEGRCNTLARSSAIYIETAGEHNRLCPQGTTISAQEHSCSAAAVERIDADTYQRQLRDARRR